MPASPTTEERYRIGGMDCAACAAKIDTAVRRLPGVHAIHLIISAFLSFFRRYVNQVDGFSRCAGRAALRKSAAS